MEALETEIRNQIAAEGPTPYDDAEERDNYIDSQLTRMSNGELLTRISDALAEITGSVGATHT